MISAEENRSPSSVRSGKPASFATGVPFRVMMISSRAASIRYLPKLLCSSVELTNIANRPVLLANLANLIIGDAKIWVDWEAKTMDKNITDNQSVGRRKTGGRKT